MVRSSLPSTFDPRLGPERPFRGRSMSDGNWPGPTWPNDSCQTSWFGCQLTGAELASANGSSRPIAARRASPEPPSPDISR